jgi:hypothetical protein
MMTRYYTRLPISYETREDIHHLHPFFRGLLSIPPALPKAMARQVLEDEKGRW